MQDGALWFPRVLLTKIFLFKMDKRHSDILQKNLTELTNNTDINSLVPKLILHKVFSQDMVDRILACPNNNSKLQALSLYLDVPKRGPHAFSGLICALMESGHDSLGRMLLRADALPLSPPTNVNLPLSPPQEDSPDSSPTHQCRMPHSVSLNVLPDYLNRGLTNIFREGQIYDDVLNLCEPNFNSEVNVRHAVELTIADGLLPEKYRMTSRPRGYALIINNVHFDNDEEYPTRNGAPNDEHAMGELLRQLYFEVEVYRDKTKQEMVEVTARFAAKDEWRTVDCACVVLMSHGKEGDSEEDTEILGTDGLGFKTRDVLSYFYNDCCPYLINKPKVFIFQSCRGALRDSGVIVGMLNSPLPYRYRTETDGRIQKKKILRDRSQSDMFVAHPVPPGIKANRDRYSGAWFIQTIVQVFSEHAYRLDIEDLFKIVDQRIKKVINLGDPNFQTVTTRTIGWNKKLFFNPGLFFLDGQLIREQRSEDGMDVVDTPAESQFGNNKKEDLMRLTEKEDTDPSGCFRCRPF